MNSSTPEPQSGAIDFKDFTKRRMLHVVLPLFIVSIIAFLDRVNIAYAGLTMKENLPWLTPEVFGMGAGIFFIGYVLFEVPASLIAARCNAMHWVARIMFSWGLVCILMTTMTTEVVIRTHAHLDLYRARGTVELTRQQERKRTELRLAAHSLVGAASIGKATAKALITNHPSSIRHIHVPTLVLAGKTALQVVADGSAARKSSASTWDEILLGVAQPWQLDLARDVEDAWASQA